MPASRLRLYDLATNQRWLEANGICSGDVYSNAQKANDIQERLITCREVGNEGWYGGYAQMAFNVSQSDPFITTPRGVARLILIDACNKPIPISNQFQEFLQFGDGHWPQQFCSDISQCVAGPFQAFRRNMAVTFADLPVPGYGLRIYLGDAGDANKRVLVGCTDANSQPVYTLDGGVQVNGCFVSLASPFSDLILPGTTVPLELGSITGIQKDITLGPVSFYAVNLTDGTSTLLLTMEPGETVAGYSRYYLNALPKNCCPPPTGQANTVQILGMVKLDLVPVQVYTDYLLIQSKEAMIAEAQAARLGDSDTQSGKQQSAERHRAAIRYLNGQLVHFEGKDTPAIRFSPFGNERLSYQKIGWLV